MAYSQDQKENIYSHYQFLYSQLCSRMRKLFPISHRKFVARLRELGFEGPFSGGKHLFMSKGDLDLTIPNPHKSKDISAPLLGRILKQAKISHEVWNLCSS